MRHLTRTNLLVETKEPISKLDEQKGVHEIKRAGAEVSFQVDTENLDQIIRYVSTFGVVKLESAPPTLEDLFMRHYEGQ